MTMSKRTEDLETLAQEREKAKQQADNLDLFIQRVHKYAAVFI